MAKTATVVVAEEYRDKYKISDVRTPSGAKSISCGDQVAQALNGLSVDQLAKVAKEAGLDLKKWSHLNPGMQRMNLGNSLRARFESDDKDDAAKAKKAVSLGKGMERTGKVPVKKAPKAKAKAAKKAPKKKLHRDEKVSKKVEETAPAA